MKRILIGLAVLALVAGTAFAGNSRILVTLPGGSLSATTTVTVAQLGVNVQDAEIMGVSYIFSAASLTNVVLSTTAITAGSANSMPVAASVGTGTAALTSSGAASYPVCIVPGDKMVVTTTATNDVAMKVIFQIRTSSPQGI